jgi:hypothetical protein
VAALDLAGDERDRPATDVRVAADLVGMGMMAVVLGDPPAVAEPNQQIAMNPADQAVRTLRAADLAMPGVVPDEAGLGEHHRQEDRDQHLPPRPPEHGEHSPADGQQHQVQADLEAVVDRPPPQQAGPLHHPRQLGVVAPGTGGGQRGRHARTARGPHRGVCGQPCPPGRATQRRQPAACASAACSRPGAPPGVIAPAPGPPPPPGVPACRGPLIRARGPGPPAGPWGPG